MNFLAALQKCFKSIEIVALPQPVNDTDALNRGQWASASPEFQSAVSRLRRTLADKLAEPRMLAGRVLTGCAIARLLPTIANKMDEKRDCILPHSLFEEAETRVVKRALEAMKAGFDSIIEELKADGCLYDIEGSVRTVEERMERLARSYQSATKGIDEIKAKELGEDLAVHMESAMNDLDRVFERRIRDLVRTAQVKACYTTWTMKLSMSPHLSVMAY